MIRLTWKGARLIMILLHPFRFLSMVCRSVLGLPMFPDTRRGRKWQVRYEKALVRHGERMAREEAETLRREIEAEEKEFQGAVTSRRAREGMVWEMEIEDWEDSGQ